MGKGTPQIVPKTGTSRRVALFGGAAAAALLPAIARAQVAAGAVRVHDHGTHTRVVVELSGPATFKLTRLVAPYRLLLDIPSLQWSANQAATAEGLVAAVRYGHEGSETGHVVVDLTGPVEVVHAFTLEATATTPTRLVLDVQPCPPEAFLALAEGGDTPAAKPGVKSDRKPHVASRAEVVKRIVTIDPGHGGIDPGAIGLSGLYEKNVTLAAAKELRDRLEATGRYQVILTRNDDESLALHERRDIAHKAEAEVFVSIHADSNPIPAVRGLSVYTLSEHASDAEAAALATHENQADTIIGLDLSGETPEVRNILVDLAQRESRNLATKLADQLIGELRRQVLLLPHTHRAAGFAVLKSPDIPSVLIEMGYLSNRLDEQALRRDAYRAKLMAAVARGLDDYFGLMPATRQL